MRRLSGRLAPLIVVLAGLAILLYPTVSNYLIERNASRVIQRYGEAVQAMSDEEAQAIMDAAHRYNTALAQRAGAIPSDGTDDLSAPSEDPSALLDQYERTLNLDGDGMMGYISIPRIKVNLPIYHGVEEKVLQRAVGHLESSSLPVGGPATHAVLSGHRGLPSAKLFTDLDRMREGDVFYIRVLKTTLAYQVDGIETVLPTEVDSLAIRPGEDRVTLVTCTPYGINSHRLLVHAHAIPYTPDMADDVGEPGDFINIPLPYLLLIIALLILALILAIGTIMRRRGTVRGQGGRPKHERTQE